MDIYLSVADGSYELADSNGKTYTVEEVEEIFSKPCVPFENWNMALDRLRSFDWNIEKLKEFYRLNP
jgi:hypothetical protein